MAEQQVKLKLDVTQSGNASREMEQLARNTDRAAKAHEKLKKEQAGLKQQQGGLASRLGGFGGLGAAAGLGGSGLAAFATLRAAAGLASAFTPSVNALRDPTLMPERRAELARESLPIVGSLFKSMREFGEAVDGTTIAIKVMRQNFEVASARVAAEGQYRSALQSSAFQRAALAGDVAGFQATPRVAFLGGRKPDLESVRGERELALAERRLPLELAKRSAEAALQSAEAQARAAGVQVGKALDEQRAQRGALAKAEATSGLLGRGRGRDGASLLEGTTAAALLRSAQGTPGTESLKLQRERAARQELLETVKLQQTNERLLAAQQNHQSALNNLVRAESALRKANVALAKEKLQTLVEEEARIKSAARAFGELTAPEKLAALQTVKQLKAQGVASLSQDQRGLLRRAGLGEFLDKQVEKVTLQDERFREIRKEVGERSDLREVQKQKIELQGKVAADIQFDEEKLAERLAQSVDRVLKQIERTFKEILETRIKEVQKGLVVRNYGQ